jgi:hypothetical protein
MDLVAGAGVTVAPIIEVSNMPSGRIRRPLLAEVAVTAEDSR